MVAIRVEADEVVLTTEAGVTDGGCGGGGD